MNKLTSIACMLAAAASFYPSQQQAPATRPTDTTPDSAIVEVSAGRLTVLYPKTDLTTGGCDEVWLTPITARWEYRWNVTMQMPDSRYPHNHIMEFDVAVDVSREERAAEGGVGKALKSAKVTFAEFKGEPPMARGEQVPRAFDVSLKDDRVFLVVDDSALVASFLASQSDTVGVAWCPKYRSSSVQRVRLTRR